MNIPGTTGVVATNAFAHPDVAIGTGLSGISTVGGAKATYDYVVAKEYKNAAVTLGFTMASAFTVFVGCKTLATPATVANAAQNAAAKQEEDVVKLEPSKVVEGGSGIVSRPSWRQSELDAMDDFPNYSSQKSFINGKEVPYGTKGSVRPDFYKDGSSIDIKNYNVTTSVGRSNLIRNIQKQYIQRTINLPSGTKQTVMIDVRGQNVTDEILEALYESIVNRTNNGIRIIFKIN